MKMNKPYILYWTMLNNLQLSFGKLDDAQQKLIVSLSNSLVIKHCVIVCDTTSGHLSAIKEFSKSNILTTLMSPNQFDSSMYDFKMFPSRSFVVVDIGNITNLIHSMIMRGAQMVMHRFVWIVFQPGWPDEEIEPNIYIPFNCQFFVINSVDDVNYTIIEVYRTNFVGVPLLRSLFGVWSKSGGLVRSNMEFYRRRWDMNGTVFGVIAMYKIGRCSNPTLCAYEEIVEDMASMMNFRTFFTTLEEIYNKKVRVGREIMIGTHTFDSLQYRKDMVAPIWKMEAFLHIAHDVTYEQGDVAWYLRSFTSEVWYGILLWIAISCPAILLIDYYNIKKNRQNQQERFMFTNTCFRPLESFSNQCGSNISTHLSARMACLMSRWSAAVLNPAYTAAILSFITVRFLVLPFADLEGLVKDGTFKIGFEQNTTISLYFKESEDGTTKLASEKLLLDEEKMISNESQGVRQLCANKKLALMYFNNDLMKIDSPCKLLQIPNPVFLSWGGFVLRDGSSFTVVLNRILKIFFSAGILQKMKANVSGKAFKEEQTMILDPVGIEPLVPVFKALIVVQTTSLLILLMEHFCKRIRDITKNSTDKL